KEKDIGHLKRVDALMVFGVEIDEKDHIGLGRLNVVSVGASAPIDAVFSVVMKCPELIVAFAECNGVYVIAAGDDFLLRASMENIVAVAEINHAGYRAANDFGTNRLDVSARIAVLSATDPSSQ